MNKKFICFSVLFALVLLLDLPETNALAVLNFTYDNIIDQNYVKSRLDLENSSVLFNFVENQTEVGKEWVCRYDNAPDIPSCIRTTGNVVVNTTSILGGAIHLLGSAGAGISVAPTINYTVYALVASNFPTGGSGTMSVDDTVANRPRILVESSNANYQYRTTSWVATTIDIPSTIEKFMFIEMEGNNMTIHNLSNVQGGYWYYHFKENMIQDYTLNYSFVAPSGGEMQLSYVRLVNWTPTINTSANLSMFSRQRFSTAQNAYNISYMGSVPEEESNFRYNISCDNGTTWASGTPTDGGANKTKVDCPNSQTSHDFLLAIYHNNSWEGIFVTDAVATPAAGDTTPPTFETNSTNNTAPKINEHVNFSINASDETSLSMIIFSHNMSGTWVNESNSSVLTDPTKNYNFTANISITEAKNTVIGYQFHANDTSNNWATTGMLNLTVTNSNPTQPNIVNTTNLHYNTNITINTTSTDADVDTLIYYWYRNTSTDSYPNLVTSGEGITNYTTNETSDGDYHYFVNVSDGTVNISGNMWNWTLDTAIALTFNITNNTFTNINQTAKLTFADENPYNLTLRMYTTKDYHFLINSTIPADSSKELTITRNINATEEGNYTIEINASDSHTGNIIKLDKIKKGDAHWVFNDTTNNIDAIMLVRFEDKNENEIETPLDLRTYAEYSSDGTKINFGGNFTSGKAETIPTFEMQSNQNIDILDTDYKGHLVWYPYGTDFNGVVKINGIETPYTVTVKRLTSTRVKAKIITSVEIQKDDDVEMYFESIYGLNILEYVYNLVYDFTEPTPNFFNITDLANDSFVNHNIINLTINGTDTYSNSVLIFVNDNANVTGTYIENKSVNISINITHDGNYTFKVRLDDKAGNKINFSYFYNLVIDATHQNITNMTPVNNTYTNNPAINFSANITEVNPDKMELWINSTGTWHLNRTASYTNNITTNFSLFNLTDGVYLWSVCANDSAGGRSCYEHNHTLTIDSTAPTITLESPVDTLAITDTEPTDINFRFSTSETAENCSLYLGGTLKAESSDNLKSYNFTILDINFGIFTWNATCYDTAGNLGASSTYSFEVKIISGGAISVPESADGGGGGGGDVPTTEDEAETLTFNSYSLEYICFKIDKFIENYGKNYEATDIVNLQEDIRWEVNTLVSYDTLKNYIKNYKQFCTKKQQQPSPVKEEDNKTIVGKVSDKFTNITGLNIRSYFRLPFMFDFGRKDFGDKDAKGIFDLINVFLPLSVSDDSTSPNVVWEGKVRIMPITIIIVLIVVIVLIVKSSRAKNKLNSLISADFLKTNQKKQ